MATDDPSIDDWGAESSVSSQSGPIVRATKSSVNEYDIFKLAKWILGVASIVYVSFGLIRIYYPGNEVLIDGKKLISNEGIIEVWEYTKVFLNSIISLILGLYFGAKAEASKNR